MNTLKYILYLSIFSLIFTACVQPAPPVLSPEEAITEAALDPTSIVIFPSDTPLLPTNTPIPPTEEPTPTQAPPSSTSQPTATQDSAESTDETATLVSSSTPQFTPTETHVPFSPDAAYGPPQIVELFLSDDSWIGSGGTLPDSANIRIVIVDQEMRVTGKNLLWDTWYFSWATLNEFYIEMTLDSGQCSGKDSYGLIFRGSSTGDPSHGYVVSFSCDGNFRVLRIDNGDPYLSTELISWTPSIHIRTGPNLLNIISVQGDGDVFTIFANGNQIATFIDDWYSFGRYGVFVNSGNTAGYTYRINQIRVWRYLD